MIRSRLGKILSLAIASLSFSTHMVVHVQTGAAKERYVVAQSCFAGTDYTRITVASLTVLVTRFVNTMRSKNYPDREIVRVLGYQLGIDAKGCTRAQIVALMKNVSLILRDLDFDASQASMTSALTNNFTRRAGAISENEILARTKFRVY